MVKAIFIDFYGTVVHEDGAVIKEVTEEIISTGAKAQKSEIDGFWWKEFQTMFMNAYDDKFETQRELELKSLKKTIEKFGSNADATKLSGLMFEHWMKPPIFEESKEFFEKTLVPIYVVSNIDRDDVIKAIAYHGLKPAGVFTSEDARSYKPRAEIFEMALKKVNLQPNEVVHIGDSLSSDIKGASALGINTVWINRGGKVVPEGVVAVKNLLEIFETEFLKQNHF